MSHVLHTQYCCYHGLERRLVIAHLPDLPRLLFFNPRVLFYLIKFLPYDCITVTSILQRKMNQEGFSTTLSSHRSLAVQIQDLNPRLSDSEAHGPSIALTSTTGDELQRYLKPNCIQYLLQRWGQRAIMAELSFCHLQPVKLLRCIHPALPDHKST